MTEGRISDAVLSSPDTFGGSPGTILRRCREFHGITLEEASETTKIGISHLKALEDDQIREFANQAYLKGFLRIYANYLGLNSDDVARMYEKLFGVQKDKPDSAIPSASARPPRRFIPLKKLFFPACLLAVIIITATFFKRPSPVSRQVPVASAVLPEHGAVAQTAYSSARNEKKGAEAPLNSSNNQLTQQPVAEDVLIKKRPVEAAKGFILRIKAVQVGTMNAAVDGSEPQQYDLTSGDVIEWKAEKKVTLEFSNAGGVELEINGKPYKTLGPSGKPAYVELDADSIKQ